MPKRTGNYKPGPGRPKGVKVKPRASYARFPVQKNVRMSQEQLDHLLAKYGEVSEGVRALIDADMVAHETGSKLESEVSQNI